MASRRRARSAWGITWRHITCPPQWFAGKRVLDVGASNGYFTVEFARRGAAEVVAIDLPDWASHDWTHRYLAEFEAKPAAEREAIDKAVLLKGFELVTRELGQDRVRKVQSRIYDLTPEALGGPFDVVFLRVHADACKGPAVGHPANACVLQGRRPADSVGLDLCRG